METTDSGGAGRGRHNVLLVMTDQHQAQCLGCMGNRVIRTPHLNRLAAEGVVFENAFCQSPVCMASRASLFTGRYPGAVRVRGMGILPPSETTLAEALARAGYRTGAFGKIHFTPEKYTKQELHSDVPILDWRRFARDAALAPIAEDPVKQDYGFQIHVGCDDACQGLFQEWLRRCAPTLAGLPRPQGLPNAPRDLFVSPYPSEFHQTRFIAAQAAEFLRDGVGGTPWFTVCSFIAPHHPFEAPEDVIERYSSQDIPLPALKGGVAMKDVPDRLASALGEFARYPESVQRRIVQHYYASITLIDDAVGRLLDELRRSGQYENTVIVFVADHGEMLGNHGLLRKPSFHYDELLRVPLIMRVPGVSPRRIGGLVELVDLYPTVLGILGLAATPGVQGCDWSSALNNGDSIGRGDIYSEMHEMEPMVFESGSGPYAACLTLRTESWKLSVYPAHSHDAGQLFDLRNDPDESVNLFHEPACRDRREQMLWRLTQRTHANIDPLPLRLRQW